jgi:hypothetical protein
VGATWFIKVKPSSLQGTTTAGRRPVGQRVRQHISFALGVADRCAVLERGEIVAEGTAVVADLFKIVRL